ncbi:MAG: DNA primase [Phycisphaerae bacterium]
MPQFSEQFIQQVAQSTDIVDLVSEVVALKKRGREFVGLCPFHDDHTPSLYVSPAKQIYKCFACGAGGGVYQFVMQQENLSFPEAVRALAERANIPLPAERTTQQAGPSKSDLVRACTFAARFYREQLRSPTGKAALEYARGRGLSEKSIERFGLGYAPDARNALAQAARKAGFREELLLAAGLVARRDDGGYYDRFRNRLMFPIIDLQGRVIAFGGRALDNEQRAKYLNSPETSIYDKSAQLYALNWARQGISRDGLAVVAEGYLDALIPLQEGKDNVVATLGTSLTDRHVRLLSRFARKVVLVFDADTAGAAASERALELFLAQKLDVRVATIPSGKDPCDFCLSEGGEAFSQLVEQAPDALEYVWQRRREALADSDATPAQRQQALEDFLRIVVSSSTYGAIDEVRRGQLAQHIAHLLNIPAHDLQQQMRRLGRRVRRASRTTTDDSSSQEPVDLAQRQVLEVLLNRPDLYDHAAERIGPEDFSDPRLRRIAEAVWQLAEKDRLTLEELLSREDLAELGSLAAELASASEQRGNDEQTLAGAVEHIAVRRHRREIEELKLRSRTDDEALRRLGNHHRNPDPRRYPKIT